VVVGTKVATPTFSRPPPTVLPDRRHRFVLKITTSNKSGELFTGTTDSYDGLRHGQQIEVTATFMIDGKHVEESGLSILRNE
jgi:hypothetical protein